MAFPVEIQDYHLQFFAHLAHIGGMTGPTPANIGHMQQSVNTAQIDKNPVIGDIFYDPFQDLIIFEGI